MKLSIFTPLSASGNPYIAETARSVHAAVEAYGGEVEWVICPNHGGDPGLIKATVTPCPDSLEGIGAIKKFACDQCTGDVLIELDHDDVLAPNALIEIAKAFEQGADFVYSDFAEFKDGTFEPNVYGGMFGWGTYSVTAELGGSMHRLIAMQAAPVTPQNLRLVDWAPNHVRAWRRSTYVQLGGHNSTLQVADDHELVVRTYLSGARMVHIPKCLYYYRVHAQQTVSTRNAQIRAATEGVYEQYAEALAQKFCERSPCPDCTAEGWCGSLCASYRGERLRAVDLCGGPVARAGYESWDIQLGHDLRERWPADDGSVGLLRAVDAIEHLPDAIHMWKEAYRVLAPGGFFRTMTPSTDGRGAFQDPTHVSFWNANSFWYVTKAEVQRYVPALAGVRFAVARIKDVFPSDWHKLHNIPYVQADLIKLADGYDHYGLVEI